MSDVARTIRTFDVLCQLMTEARGWTVNMSRSCKTPNRAMFRTWFHTNKDGRLAVALFLAAPTQMPTVKAIKAAMLTAIGDAGMGGAEAKLTELDLSVLLLHDYGANTIRRDVSSFLETLRIESNGRFRVELWNIATLQYNVLRCADVPQHRLIEPATYATAVPCAISVLPLMLVSDPVARAMGLVPGDVISVERTDSRVGKTTYWRRVIDDSVSTK